MLKSVKIHEEAYKDAKKLIVMIEEGNLLEGIYNIKLSTAIGYAIQKALKDVKNRKRFLSAAGGWEDIDKDLIKRIYQSRKSAKRADVGLD